MLFRFSMLRQRVQQKKKKHNPVRAEKTWLQDQNVTLRRILFALFICDIGLGADAKNVEAAKSS